MSPHWHHIDIIDTTKKKGDIPSFKAFCLVVLVIIFFPSSWCAVRPLILLLLFLPKTQSKQHDAWRECVDESWEQGTYKRGMLLQKHAGKRKNKFMRSVRQVSFTRCTLPKIKSLKGMIRSHFLHSFLSSHKSLKKKDEQVDLHIRNRKVSMNEKTLIALRQ